MKLLLLRPCSPYPLQGLLRLLRLLRRLRLLRLRLLLLWASAYPRLLRR